MLLVIHDWVKVKRYTTVFINFTDNHMCLCNSMCYSLEINTLYVFILTHQLELGINHYININTNTSLKIKNRNNFEAYCVGGNLEIFSIAREFLVDFCIEC